MKFLLVSLLAAVAHAQSSTITSLSGSSSMSTSTANISAADYSITALPAVTSQPTCIFNCLIPIGLADPSGCDDVTNQCACLAAPIEVLDFLVGCVHTVCKSETEAYASTATSLYESYCNSAFGSAVFSSAIAQESTAESAAATTTSSEATATAASKTSSATASATSKSDAPSLAASMLPTAFFAIAVVFSLLAL